MEFLINRVDKQKGDVKDKDNSKIGIYLCKSVLEVFLDMIADFFADIFASSQQHHGVLFEEERVVDIGIACSHGPLVDDDGLGFPDFQHGHTGNGTVGVFQS